MLCTERAKHSSSPLGLRTHDEEEEEEKLFGEAISVHIVRRDK